MPPVKGRCSMSPAEDWGFTAQQALEKLLKAQIVLADRDPPRRHDLDELERLLTTTESLLA
jgi:HEPN domain-containing protein